MQLLRIFPALTVVLLPLVASAQSDRDVVGLPGDPRTVGMTLRFAFRSR
jgi:hypothetical protein